MIQACEATSPAMNAKGSHHAAVFAIALAVLTQSLDSKMLPTVLPLVRGDFALSIDASNWLQIVYFMANGNGI
jgi:hypothetical protein